MNSGNAECDKLLRMRVKIPLSHTHINLRCFSSQQSSTPNFYDSTIEKWAQQRLESISLSQLIDFGREAANDPEKILKSAR
jgi:hypothetical protein